jgi:hypothetical protein
MSAGSILRRWDLHVHTPASYENQFGFSSKEDADAYKNDIWEKYVGELEKVEGISVVGITDYFTIDGYKKVLEYRNIGRLGNFDLILPSIELRLDRFVEDKRLNYHVIFSEELDPNSIEKEFLEELRIKTPAGEDRKLRRENIESVGELLRKQYKAFQDRSNYFVGCMNITVSLEDIIGVLQAKKSLFEGKYLLVLAEADWALIDWKGQDHLTRKNILARSHAIFSSNEKTRNWALGRSKEYDCPEDFIEEFGSLKPCIHGSDAHCFDKICVPDLGRFCWIKADPTFEGLKQIVYEPADRVMISSESPEHRKNIYTLESVSIREVIVNDELSFQGCNIKLNRNLVTIIGGKGSGKTALLDLIANCFQDRCYRYGKNALETNSFVQRIEGDNPDLLVTLEFIGQEIEGFSKRFIDESFFENVRVTYLPQGQIEEFSGNRERLNDKIKEVIFSSKEIVDADAQQRFNQIQKEMDDLARQISSLNDTIFQLEQESTEEIIKGIERRLSSVKGDLTNKETQLKQLTDSMTEEAQKKIGELRARATELGGKHSKIEAFQEQSEELQQQLEDFQRTSNISIGDLNTQLSELVDDLKIPTVDLRLQLDAIEKARTETTAIDNKIQTEMQTIGEALGKLEGFEKTQADLLGDIEKIKGEIHTLEEELKVVRGKRRRIESFEEQRLTKFTNMFIKFLEWRQFYKQVIEIFSKETSEIMSGIAFRSSIYFDEDNFVDFGCEIMDMRSVSGKNIKELATVLEAAVNQDSEEGISEQTRQFAEKILVYRKYLKRTRTHSDFYRWAFKNYFSLSTNIFFNNVSINKLSIGQKGTVLLKLFLAEGDYPLIVDMPEENLDNKFIYEELVDAIRQAKTRRQLLLATNNANLVVNTDAEQVIVAEFEDNTISYKIGAIEDRSIREEITSILEGGKEALRKREQKYGM